MNFIAIGPDKNKDQIIKCTREGDYCLLIYNYSGSITVEILKEKINVSIYGIYIGTDERKFRLNTIQHHKKGKSVSDLLIKGVFFDESSFYYEGLIKIDKNAQQSNAYQKNQNILMSDGVYVDSRPYLEIEANDVRCTHGSTTGKLSEETLTFLNLRGLTADSARQLLLTGFVEDVFDKIDLLGCKKEAKESKIECLGELETLFHEQKNKSISGSE